MSRSSPEKRKAYDKIYHKAYAIAHREKIAARMKDYNALPQTKAHWILRLYGLSWTAFNDILDKQGRACAICGKTDWNGRGPHVDHDHVTGKIRGVLCNHCNTALGMIKDDPKIARAIADYLESHA